MVKLFWKTVWEIHKKLNILPYHPPRYLFKIHKAYVIQNLIHKCLYSFTYNYEKLEINQMYANKGMDKQHLLHIYTLEYHSSITMTKILIPTTTWITHKIIILNETRQKSTYCMIPSMWISIKCKLIIVCVTIVTQSIYQCLPGFRWGSEVGINSRILHEETLEMMDILSWVHI